MHLDEECMRPKAADIWAQIKYDLNYLPHILEDGFLPSYDKFTMFGP